MKLVKGIDVKKGQKFYMYVETVGNYNPFKEEVVIGECKSVCWTNQDFYRRNEFWEKFNDEAKNATTDEEIVANSVTMELLSQLELQLLFKDGHEPVEQRIYCLPLDYNEEDYRELIR